MNENSQATMAPSERSHPILDEVVWTTKYWWLLLITGVAWIVIAIVILRFDYVTVAAIAALFAVFCFVAAALDGVEKLGVVQVAVVVGDGGPQRIVRRALIWQDRQVHVIPPRPGYLCERQH
jgi:hypothetical protein